MHSLLQRFCYGLFLLLALATASYALSYFWLQAQTGSPLSIKFRSLNPVLVYSHFIGGGVALLCGALQLSGKPPPRLHRWLGYSYVGGVCAGALGGFYLAFHSHLGWLTGLGFLVSDLLWIITTLWAIHCARKHQRAAHHRWILRSLALTSAAISLRLLLPLLTTLLTYDTAYILVSWLSWSMNIALVEIYLNYSHRRTVGELHES